MYTGIYHTHKLVVILFLLIYVIKLILLFINTSKLDSFTKGIKIPEMIISFLFLATGIYLSILTSNFSVMLMCKIAAVLVAIPLAIIGFKKHKKAFALLSVLLLIIVYGLAEMNRGMKGKKVEMTENIVTVTTDNNYDKMIHGKALFLSQCALCHGPSGDQGLSGAKNLITSKFKVEDITNIINKGKNSMPSYVKSLSEDEINAVTAYVASLQK